MNRLLRLTIGVLFAPLLQCILSAQNISGPGFSQFDSSQGILDVRSRPDSAEVFINDAFKGMTPLKITLTQNKYVVVLKRRGFVPSIDTMIVVAKNTLRVDDSLFTLPILNIHSTPSGARILVDSIFVGRTPIDSFELSAGSHVVKKDVA